MKISLKPYQRRDGSMMLYINRSNGVSVGISVERGFSPYGKDATPGRRNAYDAAVAAIKANGKPFSGDLAMHTEGGLCAPVKLANGWVLVGTDVANIGGMSVGSDGSYLIAYGLIVPMAHPLDEPDEDGNVAMRAW